MSRLTASVADDVEPPPQLPVDSKGYFACRRCRRILNEVQWHAEGCTECGTGPISHGELMDHATARFKNYIGLIAPEHSWVGRLIQKKNCPNGVFAEMLSDEDELEDEEELDEDEVLPEDEIGEIEGI